MEDCQTPTLAQMMEFKYELTPTMVFDPSRLQDAQSLIVNRINVRCFTPTIKNFQSPGLSPINEIDVAVGVTTNMENLQKSIMAGREEYFKVPFVRTNKNMQQKQMQALPQLTQQLPLQQQQQQQQTNKQQQQVQPRFSCHFVSDSPPVFTLNSTTNSETDFSVDSASPDSSAILDIVNSSNNNNNNNNNNINSNSSNNNNNNNTDYNNNNSDNLGDSESPNSSRSSKSSSNATFTNSLHNNNSNNIDSNNNNNSTINNNSNASRNVSNTNLLDRTMNISTLLRSVGLDQYIDRIEEQNMDLEQFLNIHVEDFPRMGVCKVEDQKILSDLLCELNGV